MAHPFSRLIAEFEKHIGPGVQGEGHESWSARAENSRQEIRNSIRASQSDWLPADLSGLADLNEPPRPARRSVSVSHTHDFGGWMSILRPAQIGWDIEIKSRIKDRVIERVCSRDEIDNVPRKYLLWSAKEAFYKALEDEQPAVIEQVTIGAWSPLAPDLWRFRGYGPRNGEGLVLESEPWILAACLVR